MRYFVILFLSLEEISANTLGNLLENGGLTEDLPSLRNLCPYNKFCQSTPLKRFQGSDQQVSCCEECSCDIDCFETGSCCPDMPFSGLIEPKYPCRRLSDFGKNQNGNSNSWYHVVDDCPNLSKALAYKRCFEPTEFKDYVMVFETKTGRVYRNKHCAECNDIFSYVELKLEAKCKGIIPSLTNLSSIQETQRYIMEECSLMALPPDNYTSLSKCSPEISVISYCNHTGMWDLYDDEIERACLTKHMDQNVVYRRVLNKGIFHRKFANVYCFLCNVPKNTSIIDICDKKDNDVNIKASGVSLSAILDFTIWEDNYESKKRKMCYSTEIWDPIKKICRHLFCPPGLMPSYGSCKTLFSNLYGYSFSLHFKIFFINGTILDEPVLIEYLEERFNREVGDDLSCGKCRAGLLSKANSTSEVYFRYEIFAKERCRFDTLLERIRKIALKTKIPLQIRYRNQVIRINMVLVYEEITKATGYKLLHGNVHAFCDTIEVIDESITLYCPTIMLSKEECYNLKLNNCSSVSDSLFSHTNGSQSDLQPICVDNYLSANRVNSTASSVICFSMCQIYVLLSIRIVM